MNNDELLNEIFAGGNLGRNNQIDTSIHIKQPNWRTNKIAQDSKPIGQQSGLSMVVKSARRHIDKRLQKPGHIPKAWQGSIISGAYNYRNMFVNVPPSAGKTFPLLKAYAVMLSRCKDPNKLPKILWVAETKLLASQVSHELKQLLFELLIPGNKYGVTFQNEIIEHELNMSSKTGFSIPAGTKRGQYNPKLSRDDINIARTLVNRWTGAIMAKDAEAPPPTKDSIAITCTYKYASDIIKAHRPNLVVIDEVQERFNVNDATVESGSEKVMHFYNNVKLVNSLPTMAIAVLTGSMNHQTAKYITAYLDDCIGAQFTYIDYKSGGSGGASRALIGERNAANISVVPMELSNKEIPKLIIEQIKSKAGNNLITRFGKRAILEYVKLINDATPARNMAAVLGIKHEKVTDPYKSKFRDSYQNSAKDTFRDNVKPNIEKLNNDDLYNEYENMEDQKLKTALAHGFGYIMASVKDLQDKHVTKYVASDIAIVEEFFKRGYIYSILATTSVGVGVNLKVRHLYMNTIEIFSDDGFKPMSDSSLAQLIHRIGRNQNENGVIYCSKKDFARVMQIINSVDPSEQVRPIPQIGTTAGNISLLDRFSAATTCPSLKHWMYKLITIGI